MSTTHHASRAGEQDARGVRRAVSLVCVLAVLGLSLGVGFGVGGVAAQDGGETGTATATPAPTETEDGNETDTDGGEGADTSDTTEGGETEADAGANTNASETDDAGTSAAGVIGENRPGNSTNGNWSEWRNSSEGNGTANVSVGPNGSVDIRGGSSGDSSGGGGLLPSPGQILIGLFSKGIAIAAGAFSWVLDAVRPLLVGTPYPQMSGYMGVFGEVTGPLEPVYEDLFVEFVQWMLVSLVLISAMVMPTVYMFGTLIHQYRLAEWIWKFAVGVAAAGFGLNMGVFLQKFSHVGAMFLMPSGPEVTQTAGAFFKGMAGPIGAIAGVAVFGWAEMGILGILYGMRHAIMLFAPFVLGIILWMAWLGGHPVIQGFGSVLWWNYVALVFWTWPMAGLFRIAFSLNWEFSVTGFINVLVSNGLLFSGIFWPFIFTGTATLLPIVLRITNGGSNGFVRDRARDRYNSWRGSDDSDGDSGSGSGDSGSDSSGSGGGTNSRDEHAPTGGHGRVAADGGLVGINTSSTGRSVRGGRDGSATTAEEIRAQHASEKGQLGPASAGAQRPSRSEARGGSDRGELFAQRQQRRKEAREAQRHSGSRGPGR